MNINQARTDRTRVMNISDMIAVADASDSPMTSFGENQAKLDLLAAYFGGFNTASDTSNFDRLRGNA